MSGRPRAWTLRVAASAEEDFKAIVRWSNLQFGERQARVYASTISLALEALNGGPAVSGVKARDDIAKGIRTLHVARHGRRGRHFVVFRVADEERRILEVLRLLHDAMDLPRHVPPEADYESPA
jgi:toxin ParE1/3/4